MSGVVVLLGFKAKSLRFLNLVEVVLTDSEWFLLLLRICCDDRFPLAWEHFVYLPGQSSTF